MANCLECGSEIKSRHAKTYCGRPCMLKANLRRCADGQKRHLIDTEADRAKSREATRKARAARASATRELKAMCWPRHCLECAVCGEWFFTGWLTAKYCSAKCRFTAQKGGQLKSLECEWCGKSYERVTTGDFRFCSRACCVSATRSVRRAREKATQVNPMLNYIPLAKLIKRDHGICHLCHKPVDTSVAHPHPESPVRDHVIPIVKGGSHTWSNIKLAHSGCNANKSDMMPDDVTPEVASARPAWMHALSVA